MKPHAVSSILTLVLCIISPFSCATPTTRTEASPDGPSPYPYDDEFPPLGGFGMGHSAVTRDDETMWTEVTQFYAGARQQHDHSKASGTHVTRTWDRSHVLRILATSWDSSDQVFEVMWDGEGKLRSCGSYRATKQGEFTTLARCGYWCCYDRNGNVLPDVSGFYDDSERIAPFEEGQPKDGAVDSWWPGLLRPR